MLPHCISLFCSKENEISTRKAIIIILFMISVGMLALGAEPTSALFLAKITEPPADKVELIEQEPLTESIPLSG